MIRRYSEGDAEKVSDLVRQTMARTNSEDYPEAILRRLMDYFTPEKVSELSRERVCLVAQEQGEIVGTASLEEDVIRTFFVHPDWQRRGIGTQLLFALEESAKELGCTRLRVEASKTGVSFYERRGYCPTGKVFEVAAGPQVEMEKRWSESARVS